MAALKVTELGEFLREQRQGAKLSLRQLAEVAGVSNPYLSQVERGLRKPSAEVLQQIAKGLRISAEVLYVRAGILEEGSGKAEVETSVMADPHLSERQRRVLLDIYASFRSENERELALAEAATRSGEQPTDQPAAAAPTGKPRSPRKAAAPARARKAATRTTTRTTRSTKSTGGQ